MRTLYSLVMLMCLLPPFAYAGQIYGSLKHQDRSVGPRVRVEINCRGRSHTGETDHYGSYRIYAPEKGKCLLTVHYRGSRADFDIYSYEDPVRYDFELLPGLQNRGGGFMEYKSARRMLRRLAPRAALAATIVVVVVALPRAPISRWADAIAGEERETVNLRIRVTGEGEAVANAEVFVRSVEGEFQESAFGKFFSEGT